jgi:hypothetical protein
MLPEMHVNAHNEGGPAAQVLENADILAEMGTPG